VTSLSESSLVQPRPTTWPDGTSKPDAVLDAERRLDVLDELSICGVTLTAEQEQELETLGILIASASEDQEVAEAEAEAKANPSPEAEQFVRYRRYWRDHSAREYAERIPRHTPQAVTRPAASRRESRPKAPRRGTSRDTRAGPGSDDPDEPAPANGGPQPRKARRRRR
jgi:hypothetical protein